MKNSKDKKLGLIFKKNCFTCKHVDYDSTDFEYGNSNYFVCSKGDGKEDFRFDQMYDKDGKETNYLSKSKKCHEFTDSISFNFIGVELERVLK